MCTLNDKLAIEIGAAAKRVAPLLRAFILVSSAYAGASFGQGAPPPAKADQLMLEEVVVSASRRGDEALQRVPAAISVISPSALDDRGLGSLQDLGQLLPSVAIQSLGAGSNVIEMRGLNVFSIDVTNTQERSLVAVYLDDAPISLQGANPDLQVYDLERVEVLRGPQGTLFGAGAMAGAVRYITKKPDLRAFEGSADSTVSETAHGGTNYSVRSSINLPVATDQIGVRLSGFRNDNSGYIDNLLLKRNDANDDSSTQARAALRWLPISDLTVDASVTFYRLLSHGSATTFRTLGEYKYESLTPERFDDNMKLYNVTADWGSGLGHVVSSSSYIARTFVQESALNAYLVAATTTGGVILPANSIITNDIHSFTQELRWVSPADQKWKATAGIFFEHSTRFFPEDIPTPGLDAFLGPGVNSQRDYGTPEPNDFYYALINIRERQFALFGEATYPLLPKLDLTLGARYFNFKEDFNLYFTGFAGAIGPGQPLVQTGEEKPSGVNPRAVLAYNANDSIMIFGEAARGFRYGGVNEPVPLAYCGQELASLGLSAAPVTFGPDNVWSYTLGEKGTFAEGRLRANIDAFYINWNDVQTLKLLNCGYFYAQNKGKVNSRGLELDTQMRVTERLTVGVSGSYTDARAIGSIENLGAVSGDRVPYFPKTIVSSFGKYNVPLSKGTLVFSADWTYRSNAFLTFNSQDPRQREIPASTMLNASVSFEQRRWSVALYGTNLTNNLLINFIQANTFGGIQPGDTTYIGRPRTVGLHGHVTF